MIACDFFTVATASFHRIYVLVVLEVASQPLLIRRACRVSHIPERNRRRSEYSAKQHRARSLVLRPQQQFSHHLSVRCGPPKRPATILIHRRGTSSRRINGLLCCPA